MTRIFLASAAALAVSGATALAGGLQPPIGIVAPVQGYTVSAANCPAARPVVAALQAQGYTRIEVEPAVGQARFSAVRDGTRAVYVYDCRTGAVLQSSGARVQVGEDLTPGVFARPAAQADFVTDEAAVAPVAASVEGTSGAMMDDGMIGDASVAGSGTAAGGNVAGGDVGARIEPGSDISAGDY